MTAATYSRCGASHPKIETISLTVQNIDQLQDKQVSQNIPIEKPTDPKKKFDLQVHFPHKKQDIFEIYFISHYPVCLTCTLTICAGRYQKLHTEKTLRAVHAYKLQYLATINKETITSRTNITITCEFHFTILSGLIIDESKVCKCTLNNDLESLLNNGLYSDVIIKSNEGKEFRVHKAVLASRSAVLKAHFEHNTKECHTNVIESPLEADILQVVLAFIYSDKAPGINEIPEKLIVAADYYQLKGLTNLCVEPLQKKLTIDNAIETLQLADTYSVNSLKQFSLEFIKNSPMWLITKTEGWSKVKSVELMKTLCEYITEADVDINNKQT